MINPSKIKAYTQIKDDSVAKKLADELNEYLRMYKLDEGQILEFLKKYQSKDRQELEKRQIELKGQADMLKSVLKSELSSKISEK